MQQSIGEHYWHPACLPKCAAATSAHMHVHSCITPTHKHQLTQEIQRRVVLRFNYLTPCMRHYSTPQKPGNFFGKILENLKEESARNTDLKKSIEEFKKDMEELSQTETVIKARCVFLTFHLLSNKIFLLQ